MAAVESTRAAGKPQLPLDEKTVGEEYLHAREAHARKISAMLEKSTEEERKRRMRITGTCMIAGTIGVLLGGLIRFSVPAADAGHPLVFISIAVVMTSMVFLLLGVLPTDVSFIKFANGIIALGMSIFTFTSGRNVIRIFRTEETYKKPVFWLCIHAHCLIHLLRAIRVSYLGHRDRLDQLWRILSHFSLFASAIMLVAVFLFDAFEPSYDTSIYSLSLFSILIGAICGWPNFRARTQAVLSRRGESRVRAAAIAAALGSRSAEESQRAAAKLLRCVTLDRLSKAELAEAAPNPRLFERSTAAHAGEVDAYISHSWHDAIDEKWAALQSWRERFKRQYDREPRVWLDKCCIGEYDTDISLMCLPIHLASCKTLLVLAGETYTTRMWCVMEIFIFLAAVNDLSRFDCIVHGANPEATKAGFRDLSVVNCRCLNGDTRDKLLNIIEVGCGTPQDLDAVVRDLELFQEEDSLLGDGAFH